MNAKGTGASSTGPPWVCPTCQWRSVHRVGGFWRKATQRCPLCLRELRSVDPTMTGPGWLCASCGWQRVRPEVVRAHEAGLAHRTAAVCAVVSKPPNPMWAEAAEAIRQARVEAARRVVTEQARARQMEAERQALAQRREAEDRERREREAEATRETEGEARRAAIDARLVEQGVPRRAIRKERGVGEHRIARVRRALRLGGRRMGSSGHSVRREAEDGAAPEPTPVDA